MDKITVQVKADNGIVLPEYATSGSSGVDLRASEKTVIPARGRGCVGTGLYIEIPLGYEAQIRPRSGLALKRGITVLNSPGTIDSDYRGELRIILANFSDEDFVIEPGDRIAQMVFAAVIKADMVKTVELNTTERANGGFGSTGRK